MNLSMGKTVVVCGMMILAATTGIRAQKPDHPVVPVAQVKPENVGEFKRISGRVTEFIYPPEPRAPYAFIMKDPAGDPMRIVIWRDIFDRIDHHEDLKTTGTPVTLTAEVVEYNEKIEMHVADWDEIDVTSLATTTSGTVTTDTATSAPLP